MVIVSLHYLTTGISKHFEDSLDDPFVGLTETNAPQLSSDPFGTSDPVQTEGRNIHCIG